MLLLRSLQRAPLRHALILFPGLLAAGCASNGFEKFYTPNPDGTRALTLPSAIAPPDTPQLYAHSDDLRADDKRLTQDGYVLIGTSSFYAPANRVSASQAIKQGKNVHASIVLVQSQYKDTLSGVIPYTVPGQPQVATVNTSGTASAHGSGGYASGTYNSTSTVTMPGANTTHHIPYSVSRNTYLASYWARHDPNKLPFGVYFAPLPDTLRQSLQRNTGAYVRTVVRGSPAFKANVLEGDAILRINGEDVLDVPGIIAQLSKFAGSTVQLEVVRAGTPRTIDVTLNPNF